MKEIGKKDFIKHRVIIQKYMEMSQDMPLDGYLKQTKLSFFLQKKRLER
jgi:hypothetical protein